MLITLKMLISLIIYRLAGPHCRPEAPRRHAPADPVLRGVLRIAIYICQLSLEFYIENAETLENFPRKMTVCISNGRSFCDLSYRLFGEALQATGRIITYSICPLIAGCDESIWTYYKDHAHLSINQCPQEDNTRTWSSFTFHIDDNNAFPRRADAAGPGYSNDLDFFLVGYKELQDWEVPQSLAEYRSQYSLFATLAAPMIFSADIRGTQNGTFIGHNGVHHSTYNGWTAELQTILLNKEVIAVSQDALGKQGRLVHTLQQNPGNITVKIYVRQLSGDALAVAVLNRGDANVTVISVEFEDIGVPARKSAASVRDLWAGAAIGESQAGRCLRPKSCFEVPRLATHDTAMFRLTF